MGRFLVEGYHLEKVQEEVDASSEEEAKRLVSEMWLSDRIPSGKNPLKFKGDKGFEEASQIFQSK